MSMTREQDSDDIFLDRKTNMSTVDGFRLALRHILIGVIALKTCDKYVNKNKWNAIGTYYKAPHAIRVHYYESDQ